MTSLDARMISEFIFSCQHYLCVSENVLIVHVWLSAHSAIAWNIDKKHTVNPLTLGRQAVQPVHTAQWGQLGGGGGQERKKMEHLKRTKTELHFTLIP